MAGAPGGAQAVGDTMALSVRPPWYLASVGLGGAPGGAGGAPAPDPAHVQVNTLMRSALEKVAFLPFGYLVDKYRWDVFSGAVRALIGTRFQI